MTTTPENKLSISVLFDFVNIIDLLCETGQIQPLDMESVGPVYKRMYACILTYKNKQPEKEINESNMKIEENIKKEFDIKPADILDIKDIVFMYEFVCRYILKKRFTEKDEINIQNFLNNLLISLKQLSENSNDNHKIQEITSNKNEMKESLDKKTDNINNQENVINII